MSSLVVALFFTLGISAWVYAKYLTRPSVDTKEKLIVLTIISVFGFVIFLTGLNLLKNKLG